MSGLVHGTFAGLHAPSSARSQNAWSIRSKVDRQPTKHHSKPLLGQATHCSNCIDSHAPKVLQILPHLYMIEHARTKKGSSKSATALGGATLAQASASASTVAAAKPPPGAAASVSSLLRTTLGVTSRQALLWR